MLSILLHFCTSEVVNFQNINYPCSLINDSIVIGDPDPTKPKNFQNKVNILPVGKIGEKSYPVKGICDYAFTGSQIKEVRLPNCLEFIGVGAFLNCTNLTIISLLETNVSVIEDYVFCNCYSLSNLFLPKNVKSLGKYSLSSIATPIISPFTSSLTYIGEGCFNNCTALISINFSKASFTELQDFTFRYCKKINKVELPMTLKVIHENCFSHSSIVEQNFPPSLSQLNPYCFYAATRLQMLNLESTSVTVIPNSAFALCSSMKSVILPKGIKEICDFAFKGTSITEFNFTEEITSIGNGTLSDCIYLTKVNLAPLKINYIPKSMFESSAALTTIALQSNVEIIGDFAFAGTGITSFTIPSTVKKLGNKVFERCMNLVSCDLSKISCDDLPPYTFYKCIKLRNYKFPLHLKKLEEAALMMCNSIAFFSFNGTTIEEIGPKTFMKCNNLETVVLTPLIKSIGSEAFEHCTSLTFIDFSNTKIKSIGFRAFEDTSLTEIVLPSTVSVLDSCSFAGCRDLRSADVSKLKLKSISDQFIYDTMLQNIILPDCLTHINDNAFKDSMISKIKFPNELRYIGLKAFSGTRLKTLDLFNTKIIEIGQEAFSKTKISSIVFPHSLNILDDYAFLSCTSLISVDMENTRITSLSKGVFEDCKVLETCVLPVNLSYMNFSSFAYSEIKKLQIPSHVKYIGHQSLANMDKLTELEYCGNEMIESIDSLNNNVIVFVSKEYRYQLFAGRPYEITRNCPVITVEKPVEKHNSSYIVTLTLIIGIIVFGAGFYGLLKVTIINHERTDEEDLL